jgi:hypothetical protein
VSCGVTNPDPWLCVSLTTMNELCGPSGDELDEVLWQSDHKRIRASRLIPS